MLHEPSARIETDKAASKKAKLGVKMFLFYTLVYAGFVFIGVARPEWMGLEAISGINLAIVYGFGLIVMAIVMGFVYNYFCTRMEDEMNKQ